MGLPLGVNRVTPARCVWISACASRRAVVPAIVEVGTDPERSTTSDALGTAWPPVVSECWFSEGGMELCADVVGVGWLGIWRPGVCIDRAPTPHGFADSRERLRHIGVVGIDIL
jgi:hypothetical protein